MTENPDWTVKDVVKAKASMERRIHDAVEMFEANTGMVVDNLALERVDARSAGDEEARELLCRVSADVRLPR